MQPAAISEVRQSDLMDPARASALWVTLGKVHVVETGTVLPPFFHQVYFWTACAPDRLGRDGHPAVGGLIPDMGLPRRMWAGGRLQFDAPLVAGVPAEKRSVCETSTHKVGRSGPLAFVTLRHEIWQSDRLCVTEWQDLVYREDYDPKAETPIPPRAPEPSAAQEVRCDSTTLFRYSALTFNGHRIHYDGDYAAAVEGYSGLVVHGPLLAQLLMLKAAEAQPLQGFAFQAKSPLMHHETGLLCQSDEHLWIATPDGRLVMEATARH